MAYLLLQNGSHLLQQGSGALLLEEPVALLPGSTIPDVVTLGFFGHPTLIPTLGFGELVTAVTGSGGSTYIMTPAASVARMDFAVGTAGVGPTYIMTPHASAGIACAVSAVSTYIMTPSDGAISVFEVEAGSTYIFTPNSVSPFVDRVAGVGIGDDVPTYIFAPHGSATVNWKVAAASTYVFTPAASERHVEFGDAASTYIFTPHASSLKQFLGESEVTYIFTPDAASYVPNPHREAHADYIFEVNASCVVVALVCEPLGRFQRGDMVPVELDLPYIPDRSPIGVVVNEDDSVIQVVSMSRLPSSPGTFRFGMFVGQDYQLGRYVVVFTVLAGGIQQKQVDQCFQVIGGGDAGGPVISLVCYQRGKLQSVLRTWAAENWCWARTRLWT